MSGLPILLPWLPVVMTAALAAASLAVASRPAPPGMPMRLRLGVIVILGTATLAVTLWRAWAAAEAIARLQRNDPAAELTSRVKVLEAELAALEQSTRARSLANDTATKLADYLRPFGGRKVVVSCIPNDIEAYHYATEITDALKSAKWDAQGPETTMIFGDIRAMAINVFDNSRPGSDTAKILLNGFEKLGIPYQSRVPPGEALDSGTVELFVGAKPEQRSLPTVGAR
jgi:hypothetical protein